MIWFLVMIVLTAGWWVAMVARLRKVGAVQPRRPGPAGEVTPRRTRDSADVAG
jgi:hypothetical protein